MGQGGTVFLKCALDEVQSQGTAVSSKKDLDGKVTTSALSCQSSCVVPKAKDEQPNATKAVLGVAAASEASPIDYNRYCFYHCRPYDFTVGNICVTLSSDHQKKLKGEVDPAVHPAVTDPELQKAWAQATGASPPPTPPATTTTTSLPCEKSDPCAYKMMNASIAEAKAYFRMAHDKAVETSKTADVMGTMF